jgi:hypothetical protein
MENVREHGFTGAGRFGSGVGEFFTVYTLIDITMTGVVAQYRSNLPAFVDDAKQIVNNQESWIISRGQQSNLETLIQTISLRGNPMYIETPRKYSAEDVTDLDFGSSFKKQHVFWVTSFTVEQPGLYLERGQEHIPGSGLLNDLANVPVILGLTESASIKTPIWDATSAKNKNIHITSSDKLSVNF